MAGASPAVAAIGQARGLVTKPAVKQVDRLLSNRGLDVWDSFARWVPHQIGARGHALVANVRLGPGLRALEQPASHALLGPAAEAALGSLGKGNEAPKLGPRAVAPEHHGAGADKAAQPAEVVHVHVRLTPQPVPDERPVPAQILM